MSYQRKYIISFLLVLILIILFSILGCGTTTTRDNQPDSCNDMYEFIDMSGKMVGVLSKENTSVAVVLNLITATRTDCKVERKTLKDEIKKTKKQDGIDKCIIIIFDGKLEAKQGNYKKYEDLKDCIKILDPG